MFVYKASTVEGDADEDDELIVKPKSAIDGLIEIENPNMPKKSAIRLNFRELYYGSVAYIFLFKALKI